MTTDIASAENLVHNREYRDVFFNCWNTSYTGKQSGEEQREILGKCFEEADLTTLFGENPENPVE